MFFELQQTNPLLFISWSIPKTYLYIKNVPDRKAATNYYFDNPSDETLNRGSYSLWSLKIPLHFL